MAMADSMSIAQTILEYILGGIMEISARSRNIIMSKSFNADFFMQPHLRIHNHAIEFSAEPDHLYPSMLRPNSFTVRLGATTGDPASSTLDGWSYTVMHDTSSE